MNPKLKAIAAAQGGVVSRRQALDCGYTLEQIRARLGDRRWERIRFGQYAESVELGQLPAWEQQLARHRLLVHAAVNSIQPGVAVVSHQSSLVLHGSPLWGLDLSEVHLSRLDGRRSGLVSGIRYHRGKLSAAELADVDGLAATSLARALVETACTSSFEAAVVAFDAALRDHPAIGPALLRSLQAAEFWPGSPRARGAHAFCDPLAESVGESRLRVLMHNVGLPRPVSQVPFEDAEGFIGRVDFHFPEYGTVVEFDGLLKYADGSRGALIHEKFREDRLRALGLEVVRSTWPDLDRPAEVAARIRRAFNRAESRRG